jgi:hypothetical protein
MRLLKSLKVLLVALLLVSHRRLLKSLGPHSLSCTWKKRHKCTNHDRRPERPLETSAQHQTTTPQTLPPLQGTLSFYLLLLLLTKDHFAGGGPDDDGGDG